MRIIRLVVYQRILYYLGKLLHSVFLLSRYDLRLDNREFTDRAHYELRDEQNVVEFKNSVAVSVGCFQSLFVLYAFDDAFSCKHDIKTVYLSVVIDIALVHGNGS